MPIRQSKVLVGRHAVSSPRHWLWDNAPSANLNFRFFQRPWVEARLRSVDKSDDFVKGSVAHLLTTHFTKMQKNTMTDGEWIRAKEMVRQRKWGDMFPAYNARSFWAPSLKLLNWLPPSLMVWIAAYQIAPRIIWIVDERYRVSADLTASPAPWGKGHLLQPHPRNL